MIKIVLGVLLILSTTLIGFKLSERKKFKKNVYEQLLFFCNKLKSDVGYKGRKRAYKYNQKNNLLTKRNAFG